MIQMVSHRRPFDTHNNDEWDEDYYNNDEEDNDDDSDRVSDTQSLLVSDDGNDSLLFGRRRQQSGADEWSSVLQPFLAFRKQPCSRGRLRNLVCTVFVVVILGVSLDFTVSRRIPRLIPKKRGGGGSRSPKQQHQRTPPASSSTSSPPDAADDGPDNVTPADAPKPPIPSPPSTTDAAGSHQDPASSSLWQGLKSTFGIWGSGSHSTDSSLLVQDKKNNHTQSAPPETPAAQPQSKPAPTQAPAPRPAPPVPPPGIVKPKPGSSSAITTHTQIPLSPYQYNPDIIPRQTNTSKHFVQRWCDLSGGTGQGVEWWPKQPLLWQRRAPAFLLPGAKYSGVNDLARLLSLHPQVAPPANFDVKFFLDFNFRRYVSPSERTRVRVARNRLFAHHFYDTMRLKRDKNLISFDATAGYLLYSAVTPRRLFCVAPWVKLVIVLQDPVDRMIQHYKAAQRHGLPISFQQWIEKDLHLVNHVKLLNQTAGTTEEDVAWYDYTRRTVEGVVGRSLYDIQLRHWFQALLGIGRSPKKSVLVLRASQFLQQPAAYYKRVLQFVGINDTLIPPANDTVWSKLTMDVPADNATANVMTPEFRKYLNELFRPYQLRLPHTMSHFGVTYAQPAAASSA